MRTRRNISYRKHWKSLIERFGTLCFYCREEPSCCIDHVVPYSYSECNEIDNLVPCCTLCNVLASDKVFDSLEEKTGYILSKRKGYKNRRALCADCLLPYHYRVHSPSLLLCAECYDDEYDTELSNRRAWKDWINTLIIAGINPDAHRYARGRGRGKTLVHFITKWYERHLVFEDDPRNTPHASC